MQPAETLAPSLAHDLGPPLSIDLDEPYSQQSQKRKSSSRQDDISGSTPRKRAKQESAPLHKASSSKTSNTIALSDDSGSDSRGTSQKRSKTPSRSPPPKSSASKPRKSNASSVERSTSTNSKVSLKPKKTGATKDIRDFFADKKSSKGPGSRKSDPSDAELQPSSASAEKTPKHKQKKKASGEEGASGEEEGGDGDHNRHHCNECKDGGDVLCCDRCPRVFHLDCLGLKETDLPDGEWFCRYCVALQERRDAKKAAHKAAVEQRRQQREQERAERKQLKKMEKDRARRALQYPVEDMELVGPTAADIHLNRVSTKQLPAPAEYQMVTQECISDILMIWDFLSQFGKMLQLTSFSLDDFRSALLCAGDTTLLTEAAVALLRVVLTHVDHISTSPLLFEVDERTGIPMQLTCSALNQVTWPELLRQVIHSEHLADMMDVVPSKPLHEASKRLEELEFHQLSLDHKVALLHFLVECCYESRAVRNYLDSHLDKRLELSTRKRKEDMEDQRLEAEERKRKKEEDRAKSELMQTELTPEDGNDNGNGSAKAPEVVELSSDEEEDLSLPRKERIEKQKKRKEEREQKRRQEAEEEHKVRSAQARDRMEKQKAEQRKDMKRKREEQFEREMHKYFLRTVPRGLDRARNEYWLFQGDPSRLWVHQRVQSPTLSEHNGPSHTTVTSASATDASPSQFPGPVQIQFEWKQYERPEDLHQLLESLNPNGVRERALRNALLKLEPTLIRSMNRRLKRENLLEEEALEQPLPSPSPDASPVFGEPAPLRRSTRERTALARLESTEEDLSAPTSGVDFGSYVNRYASKEKEKDEEVVGQGLHGLQSLAIALESHMSPVLKKLRADWTLSRVSWIKLIRSCQAVSDVVAAVMDMEGSLRTAEQKAKSNRTRGDSPTTGESTAPPTVPAEDETAPGAVMESSESEDDMSRGMIAGDAFWPSMQVKEEWRKYMLSARTVASAALGIEMVIQRCHDLEHGQVIKTRFTEDSDHDSDFDESGQRRPSRTKPKASPSTALSASKATAEASAAGDHWGEVCQKCKKEGELICCDGCPATFHLPCIGLRRLPRGQWFCDRCQRRQPRSTKRSRAEQPTDEEEEEEDDWADRCKECGKQGNLLCCEGCPNTFHLKCVGLKSVPKGSWFCPPCDKAKTQIVPEEDDDWAERCGACNKGGNLLCCDGCPKAFHLLCVGLKDLPQGDWYCEECVDSLCKKCREGGVLVVCDSCEMGFHQECVGLTQVPEDEWFCDVCKQQGGALESAAKPTRQLRSRARPAADL
eukprot:GILJ01011869.1.p1 GENE.GILJ01011869.1~~GILJ01011869.1.p1  ORF type:complete len:1279 (+),score=240.48 GILJ01011869.1:198-4034(+)